MKHETSDTRTLHEPDTAEATPTGVPVGKSAPSPRPEPRPIGKYIAAGLLLILLCFCAGLAGGQLSQFSANAPTTISRDSADDGNTIVTPEEGDIAGVADKVRPSVVSIVTKTQARSFYGVYAQEGAGTGIVLSKDGYVLTNKHVVDGSSTVSVVTADGNTHENVKVIGADPANDIAFLKIDGVTDLTPADLGDSTTIRIGQRVVAVGNSLGQFQNTVTSGVISGTGRPVTAQSGQTVETLSDLLQTDAAINPGNSGGPLTNLSGQVIGINTAVAEGAQGIGFAIPITAAKGMIRGVLEHGRVERAYLGVGFVSVTPSLAADEKLAVKSGAWVQGQDGQSAVAASSPAREAGIQDGDIITKVGDVAVGANGSLSTLVGEYKPGDTVALTVVRGDKEQVIKVTLGVFGQD